jgi:hypothetical protein
MIKYDYQRVELQRSSESKVRDAINKINNYAEQGYRLAFWSAPTITANETYIFEKIIETNETTK